MITITLKGHVPSKKNGKQIKFRHGKVSLQSSDNFQDWHEEMIYDKELRKAKKIKGPVKAVALCFYVRNKVKADLSNKAESIMDLLVDMGIIEDDNLFLVNANPLFFGGVDTENPRTIIKILELEDEQQYFF